MRKRIADRLGDFEAVGCRAPEHRLFCELVFCLFTPQSKAVSCWAAVQSLQGKALLLQGQKEELARHLNRVRFKNNKAGYVVAARRLFAPAGKASVRRVLVRFKDNKEAREWLVENVKGMGYKEASHFLRNIGRGEGLAILDRHILKNLRLLRVIREIPASLTRDRYLAIEKKMERYAEKTGIPLEHLDLLFWAKEAGDIFK